MDIPDFIRDMVNCVNVLVCDKLCRGTGVRFSPHLPFATKLAMRDGINPRVDVFTSTHNLTVSLLSPSFSDAFCSHSSSFSSFEWRPKSAALQQQMATHCRSGPNLWTLDMIWPKLRREIHQKCLNVIIIFSNILIFGAIFVE